MFLNDNKVKHQCLFLFDPLPKVFLSGDPLPYVISLASYAFIVNLISLLTSRSSSQFSLGRSGACGEGDVIDHVQLPPWAASAQEFVHKHREVRCHGMIT